MYTKEQRKKNRELWHKQNKKSHVELTPDEDKRAQEIIDKVIEEVLKEEKRRSR